MTILLVEDDPDSNRAITKLLQKAGFEVHHFSSAAEVLKFLKTDTSIDAVVSDVHLSDMSGFLLSQWERENPYFASTQNCEAAL
jgi:DNA-binding response OmpR family regulator